VDATLKGVVGLIAGPDVEARCAALVVLTHLKADEDRVVRAVGDALNGKNAVVRDFALGYFEQVRPRDGIAYLAPLLDSQEEALRQRAVAILAEYGAAAVSAAKPLLKDAPRRRLNAIITLCARVRSSAALDILFNLMASDDLDTNRAACDALTATVLSLDAKARADLFGRTDDLAGSAKGQRPALVAAAKLFGALADAKARRRLFAMLDKGFDHAVRTHALGALVQCLRAQKLTAAEIEALLPLLHEDDETGILRPAIQLLEDQPLDRSYLSQLNKLVESPQPIVKRFAVQKLGGFESGAVVKTLIGYLTDDSYARRDQATASLKKLPAARSALMKEFLECDDERKAWTLADILLVHDRSWKRDTLDALWKQLQDGLEGRDDRLYTAYFHFLNTLDADALGQRVRGRAEALRKKKDFATTAKWLGLLKDSPALDANGKFALAVAELKSHKHALAATIRRHDPALEMLRGLARSAFPAAEQLRKERSLTPEELLYVAFNFAEGDADDKALARELLGHLVAKYGRTKTGKAAKNKLRLLPA
jgi:HEAT repeat protein